MYFMYAYYLPFVVLHITHTDLSTIQQAQITNIYEHQHQPPIEYNNQSPQSIMSSKRRVYMFAQVSCIITRISVLL